jgi:hypothetical protein
MKNFCYRKIDIDEAKIKKKFAEKSEWRNFYKLEKNYL